LENLENLEKFQNKFTQFFLDYSGNIQEQKAWENYTQDHLMVLLRL